MLLQYKAAKKATKATAGSKAVKKAPAKRPKGLGLVKSVNEKIFATDYDYGF